MEKILRFNIKIE